ncbi:MAG: serine protease [Anaerolineae bacterium]
MPLHEVEQGIAALDAGRIDEGTRLLKIALRDPQITGTLRAVAWLRLAKVTTNPAEQREYYNNALEADPANPQVRQHVEAFMAQQLMPPPPATITSTSTNPVVNVPNAYGAPPSAPGNPFTPAAVTLPKTGPLMPVAAPVATSQVAAVLGGPNGTGTAFFVAREGLLATTRYVVGGINQVTVELQGGRQLPGYVVRAFPEFDLALIYVEQQVNDLIPVTPLPTIPDETNLTVIAHNGSVAQGRKRTTKRVIAAHWFPTNIADLADAGGSPVLDERHYLVGMMTRNTASTSQYVYGLHINAIRSLVETFRQETLAGRYVYCRHCGHYSYALAAGGYYCEFCGGLHPQAESIVRFPQAQTQALYIENSRVACPHCNAMVGFHRNLCLRCGRPAN